MASTTMMAAATVRAVKGRKIFPTRAALTLTPNAVKKIKELLNDKTEYAYAKSEGWQLHLVQIGLKVGVRQRGCNGLSYTLDYATDKSKLDEEVIQDGVRVIIDKKAQLSLLGTEMDYVENKLSSEFIFNNPNIKGTCGCGESFSTKETALHIEKDNETVRNPKIISVSLVPLVQMMYDTEQIVSKFSSRAEISRQSRIMYSYGTPVFINGRNYGHSDILG